MLGRSVRASPLAPLIAFSRATNVGIAGRAVRIADDVPDPGPLARLLRGFGARLVDGPAEVVYAADVDAAADGAGVVVGVGRLAGVRGMPTMRTAEDRIAWARAWMPVSAGAAAALGELVAGRRIAVSMVLEPKTAVLALLLAEAGAEVAVFAFAAETDDAVAQALRARGVVVLAAASATPAEERAAALALLDTHPDLLVDDGSHVLRLAHAERPDVVAGLIGASEETTSGLTPLRAMAADGVLAVPVVAANDAITKTWFDNRHGTGETCVLAIVRALDADLAGAEVVVVGFGPVGEGVAQRLAVLGARVTVVDTDLRRQLAARFAGHATAAIGEAVARADLVVSATGAPGTIGAAVLEACRRGVVIAVAGGAPEEVLLPPDAVREPLGLHLERVRAGRTDVRLLARGDCVNIVAGQGNPIDVMDLSFAVQLASLRHLLTTRLPPGVHPLPEPADRHVAALALGLAERPEAGPTPAEWRRTRFDVERGDAPGR